ncbi:MAG: hypothetical protein ABFS56_23730 [Pseudomonadota bacterium]
MSLKKAGLIGEQAKQLSLSELSALESVKKNWQSQKRKIKFKLWQKVTFTYL